MTINPDPNLLADVLACYRAADDLDDHERAVARLDAADRLADAVELLLDLDAHARELNPPPAAGVEVPTSVAHLLDAITNLVDPPPANDGALCAPTWATNDERIPELDRCRDLIEHLTDYAGHALTAPLDAAITDLGGRTIEHRDRVVDLDDTNRVLALDVAHRNRILRALIPVLARLGAVLVTADAAKTRAETEAAELAEVIRRIPEPKPGHPATKPLTHRQATALVREARDRAATEAAELIRLTDLDELLDLRVEL
jgi:hypothetical protein